MQKEVSSDSHLQSSSRRCLHCQSAKGALSKALRRFRVSVEAVPEKGSHVGMGLWKLVKTQL